MTLTLSEKDVVLVQALDRYRLLTIDQGKRLGAGNRKHVSERLHRLKKAKCVGHLEHEPLVHKAVFWLTERGADEYSEYLPEGAELRVRKKDYTGGAHARQRIEIVDCMIAVRQWAEREGWQVGWLRSEFEHNLGALEPTTKLSWEGQTYLADGLGSLVSPEGETFTFALEVETGGQSYSIANFRKKLGDRMATLEEFLIERALGLPEGSEAARLLFVFSTPEMLEKAQKEVLRYHPTAPEWEVVGLKTLADVVADFGSPWWQVKGARAFPFQSL